MQSDRSNALFRNQRLIAILVVVLFSATVIPFAEANAATLDRIKQAGKILLGYRSDARPFSYEDVGQGRWLRSRNLPGSGRQIEIRARNF